MEHRTIGTFAAICRRSKNKLHQKAGQLGALEKVDRQNKTCRLRGMLWPATCVNKVSAQEVTFFDFLLLFFGVSLEGSVKRNGGCFLFILHDVSAHQLESIAVLIADKFRRSPMYALPPPVPNYYRRQVVRPSDSFGKWTTHANSQFDRWLFVVRRLFRLRMAPICLPTSPHLLSIPQHLPLTILGALRHNSSRL